AATSAAQLVHHRVHRLRRSNGNDVGSNEHDAGGARRSRDRAGSDSESDYGIVSRLVPASPAGTGARIRVRRATPRARRVARRVGPEALGVGPDEPLVSPRGSRFVRPSAPCTPLAAHPGCFVAPRALPRAPHGALPPVDARGRTGRATQPRPRPTPLSERSESQPAGPSASYTLPPGCR